MNFLTLWLEYNGVVLYVRRRLRSFAGIGMVNKTRGPWTTLPALPVPTSNNRERSSKVPTKELIVNPNTQGYLPLPKDTLCPDWLGTPPPLQWFWVSLKVVRGVVFCNYLPYEVLCDNLVELEPVVLG